MYLQEEIPHFGVDEQNGQAERDAEDAEGVAVSHIQNPLQALDEAEMLLTYPYATTHTIEEALELYLNVKHFIRNKA